MKRKLLTLLLVIASVFGIFAIASKESKEAEAATVNSLLEEYYNDGVYVKNTTIKLTEDAANELKQYFHVENHLIRTTYYTPDALWMSQGAEGDGVKYSYYGTHADGGVTYGVATTPLEAPASVSKVLSGDGKNSMEEYYTTLADIKANKAAWKVDGTGYSTDDVEVLEWFLDFTAPCLYSSVINSAYFSYAKAYVENTKDGLKMCLYVTSENYGAIIGGVDGQEGILSEAIITYEKAHECSHTILKYDENSHWYECECEQSSTTPEAHKWDAGSIVEQTKTYTCSVCGQTKSEEVYIEVYFNMTWSNVTEVWCNDVKMDKVTNSNGNYYAKINAATLTKVGINFKQGTSWWHIEKSGSKTWNTDNTLAVDWKAGHTYKVSNVNWTYQWDNQEHKWYTCTITQIN